MLTQLENIVTTIDFHVTSDCSQECPYCWGPQDFDNPVDTSTALRIISRVKNVGAKRIVFTGGDPMKRQDIGKLIRHAREIGLEVALSTTGDELTQAFLEQVADCLDLISLPLDGSTEEINAKTKDKGHYAAIMHALDILRPIPEVDVKLCTPVTRHNLTDVPNIARLAEEYAKTTKARVFYNIFQAFPRAFVPVHWKELLVTDQEFSALQQQIPKSTRIQIHFLDHKTLDKLYFMIFPDGNLIVPRGKDFLTYGQFLKIEDFAPVLDNSRFDSSKHLRHSKGWGKRKDQAR